MRPLIYLELRQFINSIKAVMGSPKRLIPAVVIGVWVLSVLLQDTLAMLHISRPILPSGFVYQPPSDTAPIWAGVFILLTITAGGVIYTALSEGLLIFAPAHIDFLFPTPVSRRHVLMLKLFRDYLRYVGYAGLLFAVIGSPLYHILHVSVFPDIFVSWAGSVLMIVFVMNVTHTLNIVVNSGAQRLRVARLVVVVLVLALLIAVGCSFVIKLAWTEDPVTSAIQTVYASAFQTILAPIRWATDTILVPIRGVVDEGQELVGLLILAAISTVILLGRHEDVYEPSLGISTRMAKVRTAMRHGDLTGARIEATGWRGRSRYKAHLIPPFGKGAAAILWKDLVIKMRTSSKNLVLLILLPIGISAVIGITVHAQMVRAVVPLFMPYIAWVLALIGQQDMRGELRQANTIKAMPLSPYRLMTVQAFYEWLPILLTVAVTSASLQYFIPDVDPELLLLSAAVSLTFGFACVAVISIPVLLYPDSRDKMQDVITHAISFLLAGFAIAPSAMAIIIRQSTGVSTMPIIAVLTLVNAMIAAAGILVAGAMYSRFDPTSD